MTTEPTNADRAAWAKEALAVFTELTFSGDHPDSMDRDDLLSAIGDLIADLLHFARLSSFNPVALLAIAVQHFESEPNEETLNHDIR